MHPHPGRPVVKGLLMKKYEGVTLIELMVGLAIVAIIAALAAPSFDRSIRDSQIRAGADTLISAMALARVEAVRRGKYVTICPSADGSTCSGTDWTNGWLVFQDGAASVAATPVIDADLRIKTFSALADSVSITSTPATLAYVRFNSMGSIANGVAKTFRVNNTTCTQAIVRTISVSAMGHAAVEEGSC